MSVVDSLRSYEHPLGGTVVTFKHGTSRTQMLDYLVHFLYSYKTEMPFMTAFNVKRVADNQFVVQCVRAAFFQEVIAFMDHTGFIRMERPVPQSSFYWILDYLITYDDGFTGIQAYVDHFFEEMGVSDNE